MIDEKEQITDVEDVKLELPTEPVTVENEADPDAELDAFIDALKAKAETQETPKEEVIAKPDVVETPVKSDAEKSVEEELDSLEIKSEKGRNRVQPIISENREFKEIMKEFEFESRDDMRSFMSQAVEHDNLIQQSGISPDQYGNMMQYGYLRNSQNPDDRMKAYELLKQDFESLGAELGVVDAKINPYSKHKDIAEMVENGDITEAAALELAALRARKEHEDSYSRQNADEIKRQQEHGAVVNKGNETVNQLLGYIKKELPDAAVVLPIIAPEIEKIKASFHPSLWADQIAMLYDTVAKAIPKKAPIARSTSNASFRPAQVIAPDPADPVDYVYQKFSEKYG